MANTLGIAEVVIASIVSKAHNVNLVGTTADGLAVSATNPTIRSRFLQTATVRVTDHPANDAGEVGADTSKMALFVSDSMQNVWRLAGSSLGNATKSVDLLTGDVLLPV
jgi:hypothetical protein